MLTYDSSCDEYKEVFEPEPFDWDENDGRVEYALVAKKVRRCSSKSSDRSVKRVHSLRRIISKTGRPNTFLSRQPNKHIAYFRDFGNTLLNIRWRWILITLFLVNFATFFVLGLVWMWVAQASGDFEEDAVDLCVVNVKHFAGYVLLSIETIITIGYGYRYPTEKCKHIWLVLASQAFISIAIQGALVSAIYVKIAKPFTKNSMALFSRNAVVCLRDGRLCLVIRIVDYVGKVSVGTTITMYYVDKNEGSACHKNSFTIQQIAVEPHGFLIFPLEIVHVIDIESPLWKMTAFEMLKTRFEIIVVVEGSSFVTGQLSQNRTSYINSDIMWGHRFSPCTEFNESKMKYIINHKQVHKTVPFNTPLCSAEELSLLERHLTNQEADIDIENDINETVL